MSIKLKFDTTDTRVVAQTVDTDTKKVLEEARFDLTAIPDVLEDGEKSRSLKAYGFLKLMQDRNSDLTESKLKGMGLTDLEACAERVKAFQAVYELVVSGKWSERKKAAARGPSIDTILAGAVARFLSEKSGKDITPDIATIKLKELDKDGLAQIRSIPEVVEYMEELRSEARKAAAEIDLGSFL